MPGATKRHTTYNAHATVALERWYEPETAQDIAYPATPLFSMLNELALIEEELPQDVVFVLNDQQADGIKSFNGYDSLNINPQPGTIGARFSRSHYAGPIAMAQTEIWDLSTSTAIGNKFERDVRNVQLGMGRRLNVDGYRGNEDDSNDIQGLEQLLYPGTQLANAGGVATDLEVIANQWQARQITNAWGGITRTAQTGHGNQGGTGWEGFAVDYFGDANHALGFLGSSASNAEGAPSIGKKALDRLHQFLTYNGFRPNLVVSSLAPHSHYDWMTQGKTVYFKDIPGEKRGRFDPTFETLVYKGMPWIVDYDAVTQNVTGFGDAPNGTDGLYILNTEFLKWWVDPRAHFGLSPEINPMAQLSFVRHIILRALLCCDNPQYLGRIFDYPATVGTSLQA